MASTTSTRTQSLALRPRQTLTRLVACAHVVNTPAFFVHDNIALTSFVTSSLMHFLTLFSMKSEHPLLAYRDLNDFFTACVFLLLSLVDPG